MYSVLRFLNLRGSTILRTLQIEEALLRTTKHNICIVNDHVASSAAVLGLSNKPELLLQARNVIADGVPMIRRYTAGGTVYVEHGAILVSLISNRHSCSIPPIPVLYPKDVMKWSTEFYRQHVLWDVPNFHLAGEQDYAIGEKKFGGNAQYFSSDRWVHHTSFLWDYNDAKMERYLAMPAKKPDYRGERDHSSFLSSLRREAPTSFPTITEFGERLRESLSNNFELEDVSEEEIDEALNTPHREGTKILDPNEVLAAVEKMEGGGLLTMKQ